jgi:hypothetical protein
VNIQQHATGVGVLGVFFGNLGEDYTYYNMKLAGLPLQKEKYCSIIRLL